MKGKQGYLVDEIRSRYEKKYGYNDHMRSLIDEEIRSLSTKTKLTVEVKFKFC
jgi:hypothetical protein